MTSPVCRLPSGYDAVSGDCIARYKEHQWSLLYHPDDCPNCMGKVWWPDFCMVTSDQQCDTVDVRGLQLPMELMGLREVEARCNRVSGTIPSHLLNKLFDCRNVDGSFTPKAHLVLLQMCDHAKIHPRNVRQLFPALMAHAHFLIWWKMTPRQLYEIDKRAQEWVRDMHAHRRYMKAHGL